MRARGSPSHRAPRVACVSQLQVQLWRLLRVRTAPCGAVGLAAWRGGGARGAGSGDRQLGARAALCGVDCGVFQSDSRLLEVHFL